MNGSIYENKNGWQRKIVDNSQDFLNPKATRVTYLVRYSPEDEWEQQSFCSCQLDNLKKWGDFIGKE